jgi:hypothetical protein
MNRWRVLCSVDQAQATTHDHPTQRPLITQLQEVSRLKAGECCLKPTLALRLHLVPCTSTCTSHSYTMPWAPHSETVDCAAAGSQHVQGWGVLFGADLGSVASHRPLRLHSHLPYAGCPRCHTRRLQAMHASVSTQPMRCASQNSVEVTPVHLTTTQAETIMTWKKNRGSLVCDLSCLSSAGDNLIVA